MDEREAALELGSKTKGFGLLTGSQVKWIALVLMTIDHVGAYAFEIPAVMNHYLLIRSIGRLAAPLFLFMLVEGVRYTKDRKKFILRLYLGGFFTGLFVALTNNALYGVFHIRNSHSNIMYTFFYTVLLIHLLETAIAVSQQKKVLKAGGCVLLMAASVFLPIGIVLVLNPLAYGMEGEALYWFYDLLEAVLPIFTNLEYGYIFVFLGIAMYYGGKRSRYGACAVYAVFCLLCWTVDGGLFHFWSLEMYTGLQLRMVFALPIMLLYNGERGRRESKYFFYVYYPVHRYVLSVAARLITGM